MDWNAIIAVATVVSMVAYIATALYIRAELKALDKDRYLAVTSQLYATWQSRDFMEDQLWLLHRLTDTSWQDFIKAHRCDVGEIAFHRVGSFYDRIGLLVRMNLIDRNEILTTIAPSAIAVWRKIEPLVRDARGSENASLFLDFEKLLPACQACYVPALGSGSGDDPPPPSVRSPRESNGTGQPAPVDLVQPADLHARLDAGESLTVLDARRPAQIEQEPRMLPGAVWIEPDAIEKRYAELPAGRPVIVYCA